MLEYQRYGVFWAPPAGSDLAVFGASWLGWDAEAGADVTHRQVSMDVASLTKTPRKYGFHGTLKPPFRLAEGSDVEALDRDLETLTDSIQPFALPGLQLRALGRFAALVPLVGSPDLASLARTCVESLDHHRAPLTDAELAKRRANGLTERQEALLAQWGYPYVFEEFRFHLTLTGSMADELRDKALIRLKELTLSLVGCPVDITEICLFGEAVDGRFRILKRYALTG